jgi:hypothetical protein
MPACTEDLMSFAALHFIDGAARRPERAMHCLLVNAFKVAMLDGQSFMADPVVQWLAGAKYSGGDKAFVLCFARINYVSNRPRLARMPSVTDVLCSALGWS